MPATRIPGFVMADQVVEVPLDHSTFRAAPDDGRTIEVFAREVVAPGSIVHTDGARGLRRLADMGYTQHYTAGYNSANRSAVMPAVYLIASLLKRWIAGTLHHRVRNEQLPYYLDECTLRFDRRAAYKRGPLFYRLFQQAVVTDPHPLYDLQRPRDPG